MATIIGTPGNDVLNGTLESDQIFGGGGADSIVGDLGQDTAVFAGARAGYNVLFDEGFFPAEIPPSIQVGQPGQPLSGLVSIEKLAFDDFTVDAAHADTGLEYIASYADLAAAFGADRYAGERHFFASGHAEGRTITFDGLDYIASYNDLIQAFSANTDAGATHYIGFGAAEGRTTTFDGLQYIAGYDDLIVALGANPDAGAAHFIVFGFGEGRERDGFNEVQYLARYAADLQAIGITDTEAATLHFIQTGFYEGRTDDPI